MNSRSLLLGGALVLLMHNAAAFDFNKLINKVREADLEKIVAVGKQVVDATREMPESEEVSLGRDLAGRLLGAMPPVRDLEVQTYVNRVGMWLAAQTSRPDLPWHFAIVDSDSLGAFATPGGHVVVTRGLVSLMRDENELAGVLAHEIAHIVDRHHVHAVMARARGELAREVASDLAADYAGGNPLVSAALINGGMNLYASGLDQGDEFDADRRGLVIAARAGYDPFGLLMLLTTLDAIDPAEPRAGLLFATHPDTRARIEQLAAAGEQLDQDYAPLLSDTQRFEHIRSRLNAQ